jgi:superfamily II DNA or RNA helicase/HKD family nuclease
MSLFRLRADRDALADGLYEDVVSSALERALQGLRAEQVSVATTALEGEASTELLVRTVEQAVRLVLDAQTGKEAVDKRLALVNALLRVVEEHAPREVFRPGETTLHPEVLLALRRPHALGVTEAPRRPHTGLARSELFVNAERHGVVQELLSEIPSADRIDLLCAFIRWSGFVKFRDALARHCAAGKSLRVLTTTYLGATQARALDELVRLGAEVRVSYEETPTRLHAKAWLFHRETGLDTAYVGSSNLSRSALTDGIEWNVRVAAVDLPHVVEKFEAVFRRYWDDSSAGFVPYRDDDASRARLREALFRARTSRPGSTGSSPSAEASRILEVELRDFQRQILDDLDVARRIRGQRQNLVVAATGTGKTVVAAFDYRRLRHEPSSGIDTLLFVAHREDILRQSRQIFREVLRRPDFGELFVGGERPLEGRHVFASIQSLAEVMARRPPPRDAYSMVIVDEVHHAAATTYRALLDHLAPSLLLGLTATPERADDTLAGTLRIEDYFPRPWATELRVWDAIDRQILVPFNYFAIDDGMNLRKVGWRRGRYDPAELSRLYEQNILDGRRIWVQRVARAVRDYVRDAHDMRAIAFCVDKAHARLAARELEAALNVRCVAVTSDDPYDARRSHLDALESDATDRPRILCVVDLLNEGVDLPTVDTILLLRPTESATLFLQQLGRGLRRTYGKDCLTVLDFIGIQHEKFRFDLRYQAFLGLRRGELASALEHGFPRLPSGCTVQLEEKPREQVLAALKQNLRLVRQSLHTRLEPKDANLSLGEFLLREGIELADLYRDHRSWTSLRRKAGFTLPAPADERETTALENLSRFVHVDDPWRLRVAEQLASDPTWVPPDDSSRRLVQMIVAVLYELDHGSDLQASLHSLRAHPLLRAELRELVPVMRERSRVVPARATSQKLPPEVPLHLHGRYLTEEILAAFDKRSKEGKLYIPGAGVVPHQTYDFLLVTLDKSGKTKLPHLQYEDYALSPELFHWQSQAATTVDSAAGRRHLDPNVVPLLFVREVAKDERGLAVAYRFLGAVKREEHRGERPISIVYRLVDGAMPAELLARTRAVIA